MKDKEWCKRIEDEITSLNKRVKKLEGGSAHNGSNPKAIELEIEWPEADIGGLHFNMQITRGVFELKEDGNYYSRDILLISARDTDEGTGRDLLSEYIDSDTVREAFLVAIKKYLGQVDTINILIPEKNQGVKKYNGVTWAYWLRPRYSGSTTDFCGVNSSGAAGSYDAGTAYGFAPAFCVA